MVDAFGDPGQDADITTRITAADLAAAGDQHHAEWIAGVEAVPDQRAVTGLEDPQRQTLVGQQRRFQREHRQLNAFEIGHVANLDFQLGHQRVDHRAQVPVMFLGHPALPLV